jgi:hypothetical protein
MPRYRLRTLLIALASGPPLIAGIYFYPAVFVLVAVIAVIPCGVLIGAKFGKAIDGGVLGMAFLLLLALLLPAQMRSGPSPTGAARITVRFFDMAINSYRDKTGQLPPDLESLLKPPSALPDGTEWGGPYLSYEKLPFDPWGGKFHYQVLDESNGVFRVWSNGPDRRANTEDDISDR